MLGEAHEHHPVEFFERERVKTVGRGIEVRRHATRAGELTIELVGPAVVGAHEAPRLSVALGTDARAAGAGTR